MIFPKAKMVNVQMVQQKVKISGVGRGHWDRQRQGDVERETERKEREEREGERSPAY